MVLNTNGDHDSNNGQYFGGTTVNCSFYYRSENTTRTALHYRHPVFSCRRIKYDFDALQSFCLKTRKNSCVEL